MCRQVAKLKHRDKVDLIIDDKVWHTGSVEDALSTQFTIRRKNRTLFFFYQDKGITWRPHQ